MPIKLWQHKWGVAALAGIALFLAFPCFYVVPTIILFPVFAIQATRLSQTLRQAFLTGFLTSFFIMLGGFYWVTYVIHEFGYLPWWISFLIYLGFCGFGALNFPAFSIVSFLVERELKIFDKGKTIRDLWLVLGLPALFAIVEFCVPKLFPWFTGHCLFPLEFLIQASEYTGSLYLSFLIFSAGGALYALLMERMESGKFVWRQLVWVPVGLWALNLAVGIVTLWKPIQGHPLRVALVQANIGSLEKVQARRGYEDKMRHTLDTYIRLTDEAMKAEPKPDLILWPETAMPFQMELETGRYAREVRELVRRWNTALITGGYGISALNFNADYNTAFLLDPLSDGTIRLDRYHKNILLAFGEYMPFGEWFPALYKMFPQVSNFERGRVQNSFILQNGTRLGVTICYEAIVPSFYRKVARNDINAVVNLTNDSWFGPTAEPYLHGALTIFRAVETRLPLLRVTNTGTSFTVDARGYRSHLTPVYQEAFLVSDLIYDPSPSPTLYTRYGDWFVVLLALLLVGLSLFTYRKPHAAVSV